LRWKDWMKIQIRRRQFITLLGGAAAAWPLAASAQQPAMPVIGYLTSGAPSTQVHEAFRKGLSEMGYVEGRNVVIELRVAEQTEQLATLAAELVRRRVAVICATNTANAAQAAKAATSTIPIVFANASDPVKIGLVASLNRPGANVTGVTYFGSELGAKRLEMLHELLPHAATIAVLTNPTNLRSDGDIDDIQAAARKIGQQIIVVRASTVQEIETAFATMAERKADAILLNGDPLFNSRPAQVAALAASFRLPMTYPQRDFVAAGGLMSYGDDRDDSNRLAGVYVGRILKGDKPAELPVLQPVKFDFVINLKTAKALGIEFPPSFHLRATEVIE
jgi:putative ABC transport system substrate-binding protein